MAFSAQDNGGVNVVETYETSAEMQKSSLSSLIKSTKPLLKKAPGFKAYALLKHEDGTSVVVLSQWKDVPSYQAFREQLLTGTGKKDSEAAPKQMTAPTPTRTVVFQVDKAQAPDGVIPTLRGIGNLVQFSEWTTASPDLQSQALAAAEKVLLEVPKMYPAPRSTVVLKGATGAEVAFLADWGYSSAEFEDVSKVPTLEPFSALDLSADTAPETVQSLYEVVKVMAAKPPKVKDPPKVED